MSRRPSVFVHSSFRVSSTWFWTKFRACRNTIAYYEIFHERLAAVTPETLDSFNTECWDSRHPHAAPYFLEFRPLLERTGGVAGYDPSMAFRRYVPDAGLLAPLDQETRAYVAGLIDHADRSGCGAVLTCGRSLGRVHGLRAAFGGRHILLVRDLWRQWRSYVDLTNAGTYYFLNATLSTIVNSRADPFIRRIYLDHVQVEPCRDEFLIARFTTLQSFLSAFLRLHLYLYASCLPAIDLVVNVTDLAQDQDRRQSAQQAIARETGYELDLTDARDIPARTGAAALGDAEAAVDGLLDELAHTLDVKTSDDRLEFAARMIDRLLDTAALEKGQPCREDLKKNV